MFIITSLFALRLFCGKSLIWFCLDILSQFCEVSYLDLSQKSTGINWQSVKWCKILNRSVRVIGLYVISFESAGLKLSRYKYLSLVYSAGLKTRKELAKKHFVKTSSSLSIFRLIVVNRNCLQEFCCDLISGRLVFKLIYITVLLYDTIHVVLFRKTILISTIGTHEEIISGVWKASSV